MLHKQLFSMSLDFLSSGCDFLSVTFLPLSCAAAAAAANYPVLLFYSQHTSGAAAAAANVKPITSSAPDCFFFFSWKITSTRAFMNWGSAWSSV